MRTGVVLAALALIALAAHVPTAAAQQPPDPPPRSGPPPEPGPPRPPGPPATPGPPPVVPGPRIVPRPPQAHAPAPACDFNGDGRGDFVVGVPGEHGAEPDAGAIDVAYLLDDESILHDDVHGPDVFGAGFGSSLACGDFDGDGHDDAAIGSPDRTEKRGTVHVSFGDPLGLGAQQPLNEQFLSQNTIGEVAEPFDGFGFALAAGDFDADGFDDLAIGSPFESPEGPTPGQGLGAVGVVHVLRGSQGGLQPAQTVNLFPASVGARFGFALAAGDVDADGRDDLAIGAPEHD